MKIDVNSTHSDYMLKGWNVRRWFTGPDEFKDEARVDGKWVDVDAISTATMRDDIIQFMADKPKTYQESVDRAAEDDSYNVMS